jgi:uncharacterized membrane protein YeaQ/YmgE (transglycosylase-associated protein family)
MHLSNQGLLVILVVGVIAGWLAGKIVKGHGLGLVVKAWICWKLGAGLTGPAA